jgi:DNA-binding transcriptional LysR family regulator
MSLDLDTLRVFLAAIDRGSFSGAARALGRVPSAVSMAIAQLEAELDLQLFDRAGREPRPTTQARALEPQARFIVEQARQWGTHALGLSRGLEPVLTLVVVPELLAAAPWADALAALALEHPLLDVRVHAAAQGDALGMVQDGRADLALVFERFGMDPGESFQEVGEETMVAVVAPTHPMLGGEGPAALRDADLMATRQIVVAGRDGQADRRMAIAHRQWRTDNPVAALSLVIAGLGWAMLPVGFVRAALTSGQLVEIPAANFTNALRLFVDVVWPSERPLGPAARRFIALLDAHRARTGAVVAPQPARMSRRRS